MLQVHVIYQPTLYNTIDPRNNLMVSPSILFAFLKQTNFLVELLVLFPKTPGPPPNALPFGRTIQKLDAHTLKKHMHAKFGACSLEFLT